MFYINSTPCVNGREYIILKNPYLAGIILCEFSVLPHARNGPA